MQGGGGVDEWQHIIWNIYGGAEGTLLGGGGEEGREDDSTTPPKEMKLAQDKRAPSTWMVR